MNFYQHAFTRLSLLSLIIFSPPVFAQTSNTCQADIPIHQWGENDRQGTLGDIYIYNNPYNQDTEYFKLNELGSDGRYWYFPTEKKNNKYWKYLGQGKPDNRLHHWDDDNRLGGISNIYLNEVDGQSRYYRLRKLNKHDQYKAFPKKNKRSNKYWKYRGNTQPKRICDDVIGIPTIVINSELADQAPVYVNGQAQLKVAKKVHYGMRATYTPNGNTDDTSLTLKQTLLADNGNDQGLIFISHHDSPWTIPADRSQSFIATATMTIQGLAIGQYTLTSEFTAEPSGFTEILEERISVVESIVSPPPELTRPGIFMRPDRLEIGQTGTIKLLTSFRQQLQSDYLLKLFQVTEQGVLLKELGEFTPLDQIVGLSNYEDFLLEVTAPMIDGALYYQVVAFDLQGNEVKRSAITRLTISSFIVDVDVNSKSVLVFDPDKGKEYDTSVIGVSFPDGYPIAKIHEFMVAYDLKIHEHHFFTGSNGGSNHFSVYNPYVGDLAATYRFMDEIRAWDVDVEANIYSWDDLLAGSTDFPSEYPMSANIPDNMTTINADSLWYMDSQNNIHSAGSLVAAIIIDTGLGDEQPDVSPKIGSYNVESNTIDTTPISSAPEPIATHGIRIASLFAGTGNNDVMQAGVDWSGIVEMFATTADPKPGEVEMKTKKAQYNAVLALKILAENYTRTSSKAVLNTSFVIDLPGKEGDNLRAEAQTALDSMPDYFTIVASAGNEMNTSLPLSESFPCAHEKVICVAGTNNDDRPAIVTVDYPSQGSPNNGTNFGTEVDISAPYYADVQYQWMGQKKNVTAIGTSFSAPLVSGTVMRMLDQDIDLSNDEIVDRLQSSADKIESEWESSYDNYKGKMGSGRLNAFEAVFNGSFELADITNAGVAKLPTWDVQGRCKAVTNDSILPAFARADSADYDGDYVAWCDTTVASGTNGVSINNKHNITYLSKYLKLHPAVDTLPISFDYNFVSEEYPKFLGTDYIDELRVTLTKNDVDGNVVDCIRNHEIADKADCELLRVNINDSEVLFVDNQTSIQTRSLTPTTVGQTGWQRVCIETVPVGLDFDGTLKFELANLGDEQLDSAIYIDNIQFKCEDENTPDPFDPNSDLLAYATIGQAGGTLTLADGATLVIDADTITDGNQYTFVIREVAEPDNADYNGLTTGTLAFTVASKHYEVTTSAPVLVKPIHITLPYQPSLLPDPSFDAKIGLKVATGAIKLDTATQQRNELSPYVYGDKQQVDDIVFTYQFNIDTLNEADYFVVGYESEQPDVQIQASRSASTIQTSDGKILETISNGDIVDKGMIGKAKQLGDLLYSSRHTQVINEENNLYGYGQNQYFQINNIGKYSDGLGGHNGVFKSNFEPPAIKTWAAKLNYFCTYFSNPATPLEWKYVQSGTLSTMAITTNGETYGWGVRSGYSLGSGPGSWSSGLPTYYECPKKIVRLEGINMKKAMSGYRQGAGITETGELYTWGNNAAALARSASAHFDYLPASTGITGISDVQMGSDFALALKNDGSIIAWGTDTAGQLGDGVGDSSNTATNYTPREVKFPLHDNGTPNDATDDFPRTFIAIATGREHALAIEDSGQVWGWGSNANGKIGMDIGGVSQTNYFEPIKIAIPSIDAETGADIRVNFTGITKIAGGFGHSLALKGSELYGWGDGAAGQLGSQLIQSEVSDPTIMLTVP